MARVEDIKQGVLHDLYPRLYGPSYNQEVMDERYTALAEEHTHLFGVKDFSLFSTAGRSELGGNHTDHNQGCVIAATINLDTIAAVSRRDDNIVTLISEGYPPVEVYLDNLEKVDLEENTTEALVRGIAWAFKDRGLEIGGWQANTTSAVLKGSGLSSSAAIEVLCATIFNHLFNDNTLPATELAIIGKFSENHYFGKPSGLMDQLACAHGQIIGIDFADEEDPVITPLNISFIEHGYHLTIVDTGGNHADLTPEYAAVPIEMRQVAAFFEKEQLRQVDANEFFAKIKAVRAAVNNDRALLRAIHFFEENERVGQMIEALQQEDILTYLELVMESGESSFCFLQNLYPSTLVAEQGLSLAIALTKRILGPQSAVRVHGGGFAGTIQAYVLDADLSRYVEEMERVFGEGSVSVIAVRSEPTACIAE
ncbi:MAG: galactokinase family protein [Sphaerochaeta sp.]|jgi:galactokinase